MRNKSSRDISFSLSKGSSARENGRMKSLRMSAGTGCVDHAHTACEQLMDRVRGATARRRPDWPSVVCAEELGEDGIGPRAFESLTPGRRPHFARFNSQGRLWWLAGGLIHQRANFRANRRAVARLFRLPNSMRFRPAMWQKSVKAAQFGAAAPRSQSCQVRNATPTECAATV